MQLINRKTTHLILIATLFLSLFVPHIASAYEVEGSAGDPSLTIYKYEQEAGTESEDGTGGEQIVPDGNTALPDVEFTLTQTHQYNPDTDTWDEVTDGATLIETTDKNGQIVFNKDNGLELGRYEVQETDGPDHVVLNDDFFSIDVPMTNREGTELNYDVIIYPKNETVRGGVELTKDGEDTDALAGATFQLFNEDGTRATDKEGNEIEELTTDSDGKISVAGLAAGDYYFQEIEAPEGYLTSDKKIEFSVTKENFEDTITVDMTNYIIPEIEKDVEGQDEFAVDRDKTYEYNINIKTPQNIDEYVELVVTDKLDDRLFFTGEWRVAGTDKSNVILAEDGQTLVWSVDDLTVLTPGADITITFEAKIRPDAELEADETGIPNTAQLDFDNNSGSYTKPKEDEEPPYDPPTTPPVNVQPTEGGLQIVKVDKSDNEVTLEGAEFKLTTDEAGEDIVNADGTIIQVDGEPFAGNLEDLATNSEGEIVIEGLTPGTYYLHETKAPGDYRLLTKPIEIEIIDSTESEEMNEIVVENSKTGWELPTTGGMGTILFTVIGLSLMGLASFLYIRRRRELVTE